MKKYAAKLLAICFFVFFAAPKCVLGAKVPLDFKLTKSTESYTNSDIKVSIDCKKDEIKVAKFEKGKKSINFFRKKGREVYEGKKLFFYVEKNGTYTVYLKDKSGRETIQLLEVNNIDKTMPKIEYTIDGTIQNIGKIHLNVTDNLGIKDVMFYYGKLTDPNDPKWANGNAVEDDRIIAYRNATISIRARDKAGNAKIVHVPIDHITTQNLSINYGIKEEIKVMTYFGDIKLRINGIEKIELEDGKPAYQVDYYIRNIRYNANIAYFTDQDFIAYDKLGNKLSTSSIVMKDDKYLFELPKLLECGSDVHGSFVIFGEEAPEWLEFVYWDEHLEKQSFRIECKESYKQKVGKKAPFDTLSEIVRVTDYETNDGLYTGTLVDGKEQGLGKLVFEDGSVYYGEFYQGKRTGFGTYTYGKFIVNRYSGEFKDGKYCGSGTLYMKDVYINGLWQDGEYIMGNNRKR